MFPYRNTDTFIGDFWSISSVNKAITSSSNKVYFFKFCIDDDTSTVYDASFTFSGTMYQDRYSNLINDVEQNVHVNIIDMKRLMRDYKDLTNEELNNIFRQIINTCLILVNKNFTQFNNILICVMRDGSDPEYNTIPPVLEEVNNNPIPNAN